MPPTPSNASVLRQIAEAACSTGPVDARLEQMLAIARRALSLDALSLVSMVPGRQQQTVWKSAADDPVPDPSLIERELRSIAPDHNGLYRSNGHFTLPVAGEDTCWAAIVGEAAAALDDAGAAVLQVLSSYAAVLMENSRLAESLQESSLVSERHMQELAAVYEIGQAMESTDAEPLLQIICSRAASVLQAQACSIMLRSPKDGALTIGASWGLSDEIVRGTRVSVGEGIAGKVAESGQPMLITDVARDPRLGGVKPRGDVSGSMCVPLRDETGTVCGVLSMRRHSPSPPFDENDLRLFCVFATHASLALSNSRLYTRLTQKVHEMYTISSVLQAINSTLDLDQVLNQISESITQVVGFDRCCVYLLDSRSGEFVASARRGYRPDDYIQERVTSDEGVLALAAKEQIPIFSEGSPVARMPGAEFVVAPIVVRNSTIGVVVVDNFLLNRPIGAQHVELLSTFVSQAGIAVENARLYEAMEERYAELNVLYEQSKSISAAGGLDSAAESLVQMAGKAVRCEGAAVLLLDHHRGSLKLQSGYGLAVADSAAVQEAASSEACVEFVRQLRNPDLIAPQRAVRSEGPVAALLNTLAPGGANLMVVPLVSEDITIGILALCRDRLDEFQGGEFKLVSIVASHASTVLKNALAYEQKVRQRVLELSALYEFSKRISSASSLEEALDSILAMVAELVDYDESFIYAIDYDRQVAMVKAARFRGKGDVALDDEPLDGGSVTSWTIAERKALVSPDISTDGRFGEGGSGDRRVRSLMAIPLIVQDKVVGVLNVYSYSPNQYSEDDVRVLSIIASQGAAIYTELEALTALTSYTDNILSSIAAGVITLDSEGTVLTWNSAAESIVGIKAERVYGLNYREVLDRLRLEPRDKDALRRTIEGVLQSGDTYQGYKLAFHPRDRAETHINMSVSQLLNSADEQLGLVIIFEDVTREIQMENDFRRMGELAAVGQLAASIAHELRNPLSSIKGAAQFLQKEYEDEAAIVEFLGIIIEEVNGLNKLTTEFLDFARPMQLELKPISINSVVDKTLQLMSVHITDNNVVVQEALDDAVPVLQADEKQLEQVLKNMIINSLQAMPEGGTLTVATGSAPGSGAFLSVSDTGVGISRDKLERIFVPFFTTKTKGTGLGLSVVQKIVENHGGRIEVSSEEGTGTTFRITLPERGVSTTLAEEVDQTTQRRMSGDLKRGDASM